MQVNKEKSSQQQQWKHIEWEENIVNGLENKILEPL